MNEPLALLESAVPDREDRKRKAAQSTLDGNFSLPLFWFLVYK